MGTGVLAALASLLAGSRRLKCSGGWLMASKHGGFSLIEMLVVVLILTILLSIAAPSFAELSRRHRVAVVVNQLMATLIYARSEAIKRGRRVTVCTSTALLNCESGTGWHSGWIVFDDLNENAEREEGETILQAIQGAAAGINATGNASMANYISYLSVGRTAQASGALQMGTITVCAEGGARRLIVSATGRPRIAAGGEC